MKAFILSAAMFLCLGITSLSAAHWSDWKSLTMCSAKPCMCNGKHEEKCITGKKVEIRSCIREEGDESICEYDEAKVGPIRLNKTCRNKLVCPEWSKWMPQEKCDCKADMQKFGRFCNNPPPIHQDVLCLNGATGEEVMDQIEGRVCNCSAEDLLTTETTTTSTTTTPEPTTPLPWCCENNNYDYDISYNFTDLPSTTTSQPESTKKPSQLDLVFYEYYDSLVADLVDCMPCTAQYGYTNATENTTPTGQ